MALKPDFEYNPALAAAAAFLAEANASRFLLVGEPLAVGEGLPAGFEAVAECRYRSERDGSVSLARGNYRFRVRDGNAVMLVTGGEPPASATHGNPTAGASSPLERARDWFEYFWAAADPIPRPGFEVHADVATVPGGRETVVRSRRFSAGSWRYTVRLDGRIRDLLEGSLAPVTVEGDPLAWVVRPLGAMRGVAATLTRAKLAEHLTDTVFSYRASRTVFRAYQFRPVIKMLRTGRRRLLLADEVGLGKTIEAGLVWTEFDARREADRVLVVCPSGLVEKWRDEMSERFGFETEVLDGAGLDDLLERAASDRMPARFRAVCSLERLRVWDGLERMNDLAPRFDLIVVDEAHALRNLGTRSYALGNLLSDWAEILLFLSATPLNLGNDDLFNLLRLLNPSDFDDRYALGTQLEPNAVLNDISASLFDRSVSNLRRGERLRRIGDLRYGGVVTARPEYRQLEELLEHEQLDHAQIAEAKGLLGELNTLSTVITRTRKVEIDEDKTVREPMIVDVSLTDAERRLYDEIHAWQVKRAEARDMPVQFIGQMALRLAGSCLQATKSHVLARGTGAAFERLIDEDGLVEGAILFAEDAANPFSDDRADSDAWDDPPTEVLDAARGLGGVDTKFDVFVGAVNEIVGQGRQVLVFTFSRHTIAYLHDRIARHHRTGQLHGGVPQRERRTTMARFRDGEFDVMLATRVASEGLDFEFCGAVVNYDLPWNPMEVEQRIGRIDRFGQQNDKIYVLNFHTPGTIETEIIERVHSRIGVFVASIGELEPILRAELPRIREAMFDFTLTAAERNKKLDEALTALEHQSQIRTEIEDAADSLNILDNAEVDGFADDVIRSGRYVGQPELVWLLEDWAATAPGAACRRTDEGGRPTWLHFRGNAELAGNLLGVQAEGERSASEIAALSTLLQNEMDIPLCLDQETARRQGADLLNANHPLVRAALRTPTSRQTRFGALGIETAEITAGDYLVLVAIARWSGVRPAAELWTAATDRAGRSIGSAPGDALLAALAEAALKPPRGHINGWEDHHVLVCRSELESRHIAEDTRRRVENERMISARQISIKESFDRKAANIDKSIQTLRTEGKPTTVHMFESQRRMNDYRRSQALHRLEAARAGSLELEHVALCAVEVSP
jgi:superfamily II DNA or RNA helicase